MRVWQNFMISLARNAGIKNFMQNRRSMSRLATRFVGGSIVDEVIEKGKIFKSGNIRASLYYLGEYVDDEAKINQTVSALKEITKRLAESNLDIHVSVDPTQIGYLIDKDKCTGNILEIAILLNNYATAANNELKNLLMLDMEDSSNIDFTLELYRKFRNQSIPVAVTLQAYLHRTGKDLEMILESGVQSV